MFHSQTSFNQHTNLGCLHFRLHFRLQRCNHCRERGNFLQGRGPKGSTLIWLWSFDVFTQALISFDVLFPVTSLNVGWSFCLCGCVLINSGWVPRLRVHLKTQYFAYSVTSLEGNYFRTDSTQNPLPSELAGRREEVDLVSVLWVLSCLTDARSVPSVLPSYVSVGSTAPGGGSSTILPDPPRQGPRPGPATGQGTRPVSC